MKEQSSVLDGIAIIGMAGRFPGARNVAEFWRNQLNGVESISQFRMDELEVSRTPGAHADYVSARSVVDDADLFDADFFGIYPREAELMDPQQRLFMESCWQAFEDAGYDPANYSGQIGVFAGGSPSTYFLSRLCARPGFIQSFTDGYQVSNYVELVGNSRDFLATRVSYKLDLRGPSFTILSACSTSLVAVTQACQSLLTYQSDMALAGGVSITFPQKRGAPYQEGGMTSPDGHCRTFDADAQGTVFGGGVGVILLKRLDDAIHDGDQIYAVIRGFAVNNDGAAKVGFTAPSVDGQASVIALAHQIAGVDPNSIGYVEAHGTATPMGDPIELAALTKVFRASSEKKQYCTIGAAKTNVGHLDIAAGVTGLMNAVHIVRHGLFPPTLHYHSPNPNFDLNNSPFRVNTQVSEWRTTGTPRRAGVSAFGVGGTNAHIVIEQAPERISSPSIRSKHLLVLSARSRQALEQATDELAAHLAAQPDINLADAAWTLQSGRRAFAFRRAVVVGDVAEAVSALSSRNRDHVQAGLQAKDSRPVYFLFPGQGSQHPNMARRVYGTEQVFRTAVDRCAEILRPHLGEDLRTLLYPPAGLSPEAKRRVTDTVIAQPAIFTIEYALAQLWMSWGVHPHAMVGHSIGEFVAACLAGVLSVEDALALVAARGRMMQSVPPGGMLSVRLPEQEASGRLKGGLAIAAVNAPSLCVVAGPLDALRRYEQELERDGIACRRLVTSHAFHSAMMDGLVDPLAAIISKVKLNAPRIPYVSGVTGDWVTESQATDPMYWARHAREPVQFSGAIQELRKRADAVLLEVGPGNVLATLARQHTGFSADQIIASSLSDGLSDKDDAVVLLSALGTLWTAGVQPEWRALYGKERPQRVSLPTYPFERKRFWLAVPDEERARPSKPLDRLQLPHIEARPPTIQKAEPMNAPTQVSIDSVPVATQPGRAARIRAVLVEMFEELSGVNLSESEGSTTFLELGFDSLFLTQVAQTLQSKLGLKVTFRQLLDNESSLDALTEFGDRRLPAEVFAEASASLPAASAPHVAGVADVPPPPMTALSNRPGANAVDSASPVERLVREQLQAMNELFARQLDAVRGSAPPEGAPALQPTPVTTAVAPAAIAATATTKAEFKSHGPYRPVQKGTSGDLTARQDKHLGALIERYTRRTGRSKSMTQEHRQVLADPRVVSGFRLPWKEMVYPIVTNRSKGSRLWDIDGNEYIDLVNGFGPIMLGHSPDFVEKAIEQQLHLGIETGPQSPLAGEVARMFCEMTGQERMTFCNTGSEAVMAALRVARTVTGRDKVVMFSGDYHGLFDEVLVKGFRNKAGIPQSAPIAPGIPRDNVSNIIVLEYGAADSLEWIRQHATELAAVLVEPVQSRHPDLQPIEFLKAIRKVTEDAGAALIFDEVVTGFRTHQGGCQALFGIRADLATYGKVVAGGMPVGILAGKAQFMDALDGGMWQFGDDSFPEVGVTFFAGTFVRHPLVVAAMKAVLEHFKEHGPELQERLTERTTRLVRMLNGVVEDRMIPTRIESFGSFFYFGFPSEERFASLFYFYMRERGIHIREGFPCFLTTAHSDADLEAIVQAFTESMDEMQKAGFFAEPTARLVSDADLPATSIRQGEASEAPLTEPQLEVWLSDQISEEASCSYNESITLHMRGKVNEVALTQALELILGRHDALRATFSQEGTLQRFSPMSDLKIEAEDWGALDVTEREPRLRHLVHDNANTPFKLGEGPLYRIQLVKFAPEQQLLIFTAHHIICDGWSTNVLLEELSKAYNAFNRRTACDLPPAVSFASYANAQVDYLNGSEGAKVERFWLDVFKQPPAVLELPTDRPRPPIKEYSGATYRTRIGADVYNSVKKLGARHKCTLFVTLLAAFKVLLKRLGSQDDIVVGIPTAGQSLLEGQSLVGHCVNFIPLRSDLSANPTVAQLLPQLKQTVLASYENQNYTYGRLVRKLALERDPSRLPLTEVQFNLERLGDGLNFDGLDVEIDPNPKSFVNFDIFLNVVESKDGLVLDCDFNTGLFDEATIENWLRHYETLLNGMVAEPDQVISKLPLLSATDTRLQESWDGPAVEHHGERCVHRLFEAQVKRTPDAVAVVLDDRQISYADLDRRANQLAHHLRALGVKPGVLVGVFIERNLEMIVALLATLKAGGAYVPIDPTFPQQRLQYVLGDANVPVVLTQAALTKAWSFGNAQVVQLDTDWHSIAEQSLDKPAELATPDDLAYVIYTSGSTGKPKGVEIQHRAVVNLLSAMRSSPGLNQTDTIAAVTTLSFDIAGLELFLPLIVGAKLAIVTRETAQYGVQLLEYLKRIKATVVQATPVTWKQLIEAGWDGDPALKVLCGGEVFPRELANELLTRVESVWNMYGPTETTIWSAVAKVEAGMGPVRIGRPIANTQFYVLDKDLQRVPVGVPGELHIAGHGLARGYLNRPELTAEKFVPNPFAAKAGARMYKTGDLVRLGRHGMLEFLGRLDDQIKLRGFRIELGEIESVLTDHPSVDEAVVLLREDVPGEQRLVAYLVYAAGGAPTAMDLRNFVVTQLPAYMAPAAFVPVEKFPLTPNGKIDRRALPAPDWSAPSRSTTYEAPRNPGEQAMAEIWAQVLGLERVGINDNLFALGADSLHVFQIAARAGKAGIPVTPRQILQNRTIAAILAESEKTPVSKPQVATIKPVARQRYRPNSQAAQ